MKTLILKARVLPRGVSDAAVTGAVGFVQMFVLFFVPACVVGTVARSLEAGLFTCLIIYVFWLLFTVRHLRCDEQALEFVRTLGMPKRIPWAELGSVEEVPRAELVLRGWLWPPFPAREMTPSLTSIGHYRISWREGDAYFPPRDVQAFLEAIRRGREGAAQQGDGADARRRG